MVGIGKEYLIEVWVLEIGLGVFCFTLLTCIPLIDEVASIAAEEKRKIDRSGVALVLFMVGPFF